MSQVKQVCFDRLLPKDTRRAIRFMSFGTDRTRALAPIGKLWINGSRLSVRFLGGTAAQQQLVKQHAVEWSQHANLTFSFDQAANADIRIAFEDDGAWSYIGTDAKEAPLNQPTMNFGWVDRAVILHEFGHALGLGHEHSNPLGGINWNEAQVIADLSGSPNFWDEETIRHNVFHKYSHDQINGTAFDPKSIMLYSFPKEWTSNGFHTEPNGVLSAIDQAFVAGSKMYPKATVNFVDLPVFDPRPTLASIGVAGEEDRYRFRVQSPGRYRLETSGQTDVVMKLFGPESPTELIAEDDDGGSGVNSLIEADLMPGQYFVQIRHYGSGTGDYGVTVVRT